MSSEGRGPGLLLVLSAPSGAGKTTLAHRFRAAHPDAVFSVSVTTRAPRGAERDGVDYHFATPERFTELVAQGAFAEWAEVHGKRYGTLRATVEEALRAGSHRALRHRRAGRRAAPAGLSPRRGDGAGGPALGGRARAAPPRAFHRQ